MNIYVASSWRTERHPTIVALIRAAGHKVHDYRNPPTGKGFSWSEIDPEWKSWTAEDTRRAYEHDRTIHALGSDLGGMMWADAIVMVQPCGRSASLELGWGIGAGKFTIALLEDGQEPELMLRLADRICISTDELLIELASERRRQLTERVSP